MTVWADIWSEVTGRVVYGRPTLFTVAGSAAGWWEGYPADLGRRLEAEGLYRWQPVGYPAAIFPMGGSRDAGVRELIRLIEATPGPFALAGYSQGAMVIALVYRELVSGRLKHRRRDFVGAVAFGNPMRAAGHSFPGGPDPGGRGIASELMVDPPANWHDYADPGDIYCCTPVGVGGAEMTAIYDVVMDPLKGSLSLVREIAELLADPLGEAPALVKAVVLGLRFAASNPVTAPHIEYHIRHCVPGVTYFDHAVESLRRFAAALVS